MNDANLTKIEKQALEAMYAEAIREKNQELYRILVHGTEAEVQGLLDRFFR